MLCSWGGNRRPGVSLYTGISSGPNARYRVWEAFTFFCLISLCNCERLSTVPVCRCQMTGDMVSVDALSIVGISSLKDRLTELVRRVRELRLDLNEYICLKYILLLNPGLPCCIL